MEEEFYPHRCVCKKCDYQRTRAYRAANRDKILAAGRARYQRNCVPCCSLCNYIKRDLSLEQCFAHIRRMLAHSESKGLDNANL